MSVSTAGLVVFVAFVLATVAALVFDLYRALSGLLTITEWATRKWWRVALIITLCAVGVAGLGVHFLTFNLG